MKKRWFVMSVYHPGGLKTLNDALMEIVKVDYLYHIIPEDRLNNVVEQLKAHQEDLHGQNRRLRKVDISLYQEDEKFNPGRRTLAIGDARVTLQKVMGEMV